MRLLLSTREGTRLPLGSRVRSRRSYSAAWRWARWISRQQSFSGGSMPARDRNAFCSRSRGLLGASASSGGWRTAMLGLFLHFVIAFIVAVVYYIATRRLSTLIRRYILWGVIYGLAVYFVMNYAVLPLSAFPRRSGFSLVPFVSGLIIHALFVGLPVALVARWSATRSR